VSACGHTDPKTVMPASAASPRCGAALFGRVRSGRGQHDRAIAANLGYAPADIDAMVRDGVLYAEEAVARLASTP
jgi:hypothetical protein